MVLNWLTVHHPDLITVNENEVKTHMDGYEHTFQKEDFRHCPLRLACMLVQEDLVLMREEEVMDGGTQNFSRDSLDMQREDHPTGMRNHCYPVRLAVQSCKV